MSGLHWHKRDHNERYKETRRLSPMARCVLNDLVDTMYSTGKPLPYDIPYLCHICVFRDKRQIEKPLQELIDTGFITVTDKGLCNPVAMELIEAANAHMANGKKGGRPSKKQASVTDQSAISPASVPDQFSITSSSQGSGFVENQLLSQNPIELELDIEKEKKEPPMPPGGGGVISSHFRALSVVGYSDVCLASRQAVAATANVSDLFGGEPSAPPKPTKPTKPKRSRRQVDYSADFLRFWELNPDRGPDGHNKKRSKANWEAAVEAGALPEDLIRGWGIYAESKRTSPDYGTHWVKSAQNFLDPEERMWTRFQTAPNVHVLRLGQNHNGFDRPRRQIARGQAG